MGIHGNRGGSGVRVGGETIAGGRTGKAASRRGSNRTTKEGRILVGAEAIVRRQVAAGIPQRQAGANRQSEEFAGIEEDGDRAIIHEVDGHVRLEDACLDANAGSSQRGDEFLVERFAEFGRSSQNEAGAAAAARVGVESELRDGENGAACVEKRAIHLSLVIIEDAEIDDFFGHRSGGGGGIFAAYGDEDDEARPNFAGDAAIDRDARARDSLEYDSHRLKRMILPCERSVWVLFAKPKANHRAQLRYGEHPGHSVKFTSRAGARREASFANKERRLAAACVREDAHIRWGRANSPS